MISVVIEKLILIFLELSKGVVHEEGDGVGSVEKGWSKGLENHRARSVNLVNLTLSYILRILV